MTQDTRNRRDVMIGIGAVGLLARAWWKRRAA